MKHAFLLAAAWAALLAVAFATLSPIGIRPHIPVPANVERAFAFFVIGTLFALAYPKRIWWALAIMLIGVFGLELLQELRPDRHARLGDAAAKATGALLGLSLGWFVRKIRKAVRQP